MSKCRSQCCVSSELRRVILWCKMEVGSDEGVVAISHSENSTGKSIADTKVRYFWVLQLDGKLCRIEFANSKTSGKKRVFMDGRMINEQRCYMSQNFNYTWPVGSHFLSIVPKQETSGSPNNIVYEYKDKVMNKVDCGFELRINGYPFQYFERHVATSRPMAGRPGANSAGASAFASPEVRPGSDPPPPRTSTSNGGFVAGPEPDVFREHSRNLSLGTHNGEPHRRTPMERMSEWLPRKGEETSKPFTGMAESFSSMTPWGQVSSAWPLSGKERSSGSSGSQVRSQSEGRKSRGYGHLLSGDSSDEASVGSPRASATQNVAEPFSSFDQVPPRNTEKRRSKEAADVQSASGPRTPWGVADMSGLGNSASFASSMRVDSASGSARVDPSSSDMDSQAQGWPPWTHDAAPPTGHTSRKSTSESPDWEGTHPAFVSRTRVGEDVSTALKASTRNRRRNVPTYPLPWEPRESPPQEALSSKATAAVASQSSAMPSWSVPFRSDVAVPAKGSFTDSGNSSAGDRSPQVSESAHDLEEQQAILASLQVVHGQGVSKTTPSSTSPPRTEGPWGAWGDPWATDGSKPAAAWPR